MGSQPLDGFEAVEESESVAFQPSSAPRWGSRLWPLLTLGITTIALATSAYIVVASAISPGDPPQSFAPKPPTPGAVRPVISQTPPPPPAAPIKFATKPQPLGISDRPITTGSTASTKSTSNDVPPPTPRPVAPMGSKAAVKRIMVRDHNGKVVVSRIHGQDQSSIAVLLPDGSIGFADGLTYTDRPFVPLTMDEMRESLQAKEFTNFEVIESKHYLVFTQGSKAYAQNSASTLESLYNGLSSVLSKRGVAVHDPEFPLVAVIFRSEEDFRRHKQVAPDVQAYYDILSNRIFLYETSARDRNAPNIAALQKPQTVAHEGTHQILQNIGVQPRLSSWPLWLVEGLAEYCATPKLGKNGVPTWSGLGQPNLLHIVTMRDLDDPLSSQIRGGGNVVRRDRSKTMIEYLVTKTDLTPTDYALSWALTYHLALKRGDDFLDFLREMSAMPPLEKRSPADHLQAFKEAFGDNLVKVETAVSKDVQKLKQIDALPYYAVMFQQPMGQIINRKAIVSQSPSVIRQWIENNTDPRGGQPGWEVVPQPTKARAVLTVEHWIKGG
jgi:hypothetical protein